MAWRCGSLGYGGSGTELADRRVDELMGVVDAQRARTPTNCINVPYGTGAWGMWEWNGVGGGVGRTS